MQKFYFHDATNTLVAGTLPVAKQSSFTATVTASTAATNRLMDGTIGTTQTSASLATSAVTTQQFNWLRRWMSPPIAASQTLNAHTSSSDWTYHIAGLTSNASNSDFWLSSCLYLWRPSSGALVTMLFDRVNASVANGQITSATEQALTNVEPLLTGTGTTVITQAGDVLVFELWANVLQGMATSYTNTAFYDGTTEDSASTNASYIFAPNNLVMLADSLPRRLGQPAGLSQAVHRAASRMIGGTRRSRVRLPHVVGS